MVSALPDLIVNSLDSLISNFNWLVVTFGYDIRIVTGTLIETVFIEFLLIALGSNGFCVAIHFY